MLNNDGTSTIYALTDYGDNALPSNGYPPDGVICPNPMIALNPLPGPTNSNFSTAAPPPATSVNGAIFRGPNGAAPYNEPGGGTEPYNFTTVCAYGGTNIADALDMALSMELNPPAFPKDPSTTPGTQGVGGRAAQNLSRAGATRAIVLFTDGLPTEGGDNGTSDSYSKAEATCASTAGIPIYTIGLCMVSSLQSNQSTVLGTSSNGIAGISGHGASFSQTTSAAGLNAVFQNVARQLVQLVQ
jgi:hypothetical protein